MKKLAIWSISKNCLVSHVTTKIMPTDQFNLHLADVGIKKVPVWFVTEDLELDLDEEFDYVWFVE